MGSYTILERQKLRKMEELENKIDKLQKEETEIKKEKEKQQKEYKKDLKKALEKDLYFYFIEEFTKNNIVYNDLYNIKENLSKIETQNKILSKLGCNEYSEYLYDKYFNILKKAYDYAKRLKKEEFDKLPKSQQDFIFYTNIQKQREIQKQIEKDSVLYFHLATNGEYLHDKTKNKKIKKFGLITFINLILGK